MKRVFPDSSVVIKGSDSKTGISSTLGRSVAVCNVLVARIGFSLLSSGKALTALPGAKGVEVRGLEEDDGQDDDDDDDDAKLPNSWNAQMESLEGRMKSGTYQWGHR